MSAATHSKVRFGATLLIVVGFGAILALTARGDVADDTADSVALAPDADLRAASGQEVHPATAQIGTSVEDPPGEVRWTYVSYLTSDGPCLDLVAEQIKGGDTGRIVRCGKLDTSEYPFRWSIGGVELGGTLYNVVEGDAAQGASRVRVILGDGTTVSAPLVDGSWLAVVPSETSLSFDPEQIQQLDASGARVAAVRPPSVADSFEATLGDESAGAPEVASH